MYSLGTEIPALSILDQSQCLLEFNFIVKYSKTYKFLGSVYINQIIFNADSEFLMQTT